MLQGIGRGRGSSRHEMSTRISGPILTCGSQRSYLCTIAGEAARRFRKKMMQRCAAFLLLCFLALAATASGQPGFISIDCGLAESSNYTSESGIVYSPDAAYVEGGVNIQVPKIGNLSSIPARYWWTMRSFPNGTRNCYTVGPVIEGQLYLVRAGFFYGNYDGKNSPPEFRLYLGVNFWQAVETMSDNTVLAEIIVLSPANALEVCLVKTGTGTPFISVLEVRLVQNSVYKIVNGYQSLVLRGDRVDYGGNQSTRYPADPYDRIWYPSANRIGWTTVSTEEGINSTESGTLTVPQAVLRTAVISEGLSFTATVDSDEKTFIFMYFAELEQLGSNETRVFNVLSDGQLWYGPYTPRYLNGGTLLTSRTGFGTTDIYNLSSTSNSTRPPMINAREVYGLKRLEFSPTDSGDRAVISGIKGAYEIKKNWQWDPCLPKELAWEGVGCLYDESVTPRIFSLNLSGSGLQGGISPSIANLTALMSLDLSNNNLTGKIPDELTKLKNLKVLNLTNNRLNGLLPEVFYKKSENGSLHLSIDGNTELCKKVDVCQSAIEERKKNNIPIIGGVAAAPIFVVGGVVILVWWFKSRKRSTVQTTAREMKNPGDLTGQLDNVPERFNNSQSYEFSFANIAAITKNFKRLIGRGGFATVYYGSLDGGREVAVKLLSRSSEGRKDFHAEGRILTRVHHKNLVRLLGYCDEKHNLALVYEYMRNGSLAEQLSCKGGETIPLDWDTRLRIAVDVAQGLDYLHNFCKPAVVHRDIKTRNILLNEHFEAKLGDFGLSRLFSRDDATHISTMVAGTPGYLDPEYYQSLNLTTKSDVYSFGIVLLEIITGQSPTSCDAVNGTLLSRVKSRVHRGDIDSIADKRLNGCYDHNSMWKALEIAMKCASPTSAHRPKMNKVVAELKECLRAVASPEISHSYEKPHVSLVIPSSR